MYILRNDIYQNRKKIISFCLGAVAYTLLLTYFWTLFSDTFGQMLDLFPDAVKAIAGFGDDLSVFDKIIKTDGLDAQQVLEIAKSTVRDLL